MAWCDIIQIVATQDVLTCVMENAQKLSYFLNNLY